MKEPKSAVLVLFLTIICTLPAYAEYNYQIVLPPDADNARIFGINNAGTAVGWFYTDVGFASFEYDIKKGEYTMLGDEFVAMAISDTGLMVGNPGDTPWKCAIRDKKGIITPLYPPSWNDAVSICDARGVNADGKVSGFVTDEFDVWWGFIFDPEYGTFEEFLPSAYTVGHGINAKGQSVGTVEDYGYVRQADGTVKTFAIEQSLFGIANARGISANGLMSGWYIKPDTWAYIGFVIPLLKGEGFETISLGEDEILHMTHCDPDLEPAPSGYLVITDTVPTGIRNDGVIVGNCADWYVSDDGNDWVQVSARGFIATPVK